MVAMLVASVACQVDAPTKVEPCKCLICVASDSLDYYSKLDSEAWDSTWMYRHSENFDEWYDSLTVLLIEDIDATPLDSIQFYCKDLKKSEPFMRCINKGFDGLCTWEAYPRRFGKDAVKVFGDSTPYVWVESSVRSEWYRFQTKVDTFFHFMYEED